MPNKYYYNHTYEEKIEEEDRECYNDYLRAKTEYYDTKIQINNMIIDAMDGMNVEDVRKMLYKVPVIRI